MDLKTTTLYIKIKIILDEQILKRRRNDLEWFDNRLLFGYQTVVTVKESEIEREGAPDYEHKITEQVKEEEKREGAQKTPPRCALMLGLSDHWFWL